MKRAHIIPVAGGDEYDALTRWRRVYHWKSGTRKAIRRGYSRRQRTVEHAHCGVMSSNSKERGMSNLTMTRVSGNIFTDLGFNPDEAQNLLLRAQTMI
ncbi:MAG: hypothetical protein HY066_03655 [Betaproteobacteria bacterium]|nr:hypothetical protein [Betaproteobacteria bacterium]